MRLINAASSHRTGFWMSLPVLMTSIGLINANYAHVLKGRSLQGLMTSAAHVSELKTETVVKQFHEADHSVLLLDYDGTLVRHEPEPHLAVPTQALQEALGALNKRYPSIKVSIISGRNMQFLEHYFDRFNNFLLAAEHGAFVRKPGMKEWEVRVPPIGERLKKNIELVMEDSCMKIPGSWAEKKDAAVVWHYRKATDQKAATSEVQQLMDRIKLSGLTKTLHAEPGEMILEVKAKAFKSESAIESWKAQPQATAILAMGDDTADEVMFQAVTEHALSEGQDSRAALTTAIVNNYRKRTTAAKAHIPSVEDAVNLLRSIAGLAPVRNLYPQ